MQSLRQTLFVLYLLARVMPGVHEWMRGSRQRHPPLGCSLKLALVKCRSPARAVQAVREEAGQGRHGSCHPAHPSLTDLRRLTEHQIPMPPTVQFHSWHGPGLRGRCQGVGRWRCLKGTEDDELQLCMWPSTRELLAMEFHHMEEL